VAVIQSNLLDQEEIFLMLLTQDNSVTTTPAKLTSRVSNTKPGSIIDLTVASKEDLSGK
jgi:hypothetical protein